MGVNSGYKVWCLNSDDGYLVTFDLYQGCTYEGNEVNEKLNKIMVCRWMDNAVVSVASTVHTNNASSKVRRYSQSEKRNVEVDCPKIVQEYNQHMGGTDRQNQNVNKYRIGIRWKKWHWCIFTRLIDVTEQNAWLLHKKSGGDCHSLNSRNRLLRHILIGLVHHQRELGDRHPAQQRVTNRVLEDIRFDGIEHYLVETQDNKRRCAGEGCKKRPFSQCSKCNVGLLGM
ncbi:piggyBac transposable element-derived protein 3-like [Palaemon carinicauda]|uniref:piggyBac transposable element-derived protein 3-like n=1 Tax=Palaemon carinicauda TaxID=392227 RepID=UPI0035B64C48